MRRIEPIDSIITLMWSNEDTMPDKEVVSDDEIIKVLDNVENLEQTDCYGRTYLMCSVIYKRTKVLKYLLQKGAEPNEQDENGFSALHFAVQENNSEAVEILLKSKADACLTNKFGNSAILLGRLNTSLKIFELLLECGADPYQKNIAGVCAMDVYVANPEIMSVLINIADASVSSNES